LTNFCRHCGATLRDSFADLGVSPLANSFIPAESRGHVERFYPLHALVCAECKLVQLQEFEAPQAIFRDYLYFSSYSSSWLTHCERYAEEVIDRLALDEHNQVVEIASNDGYLLQYFVHRGIPVLGIEPAENVAAVARANGIPTEAVFFGSSAAMRLREQGRAADLIVANNVLAHVPDINDFIKGVALLLKPDGLATFEFPHLMRLMQFGQFDTIYHEHFSYISLLAADRIFAAQGLRIVDVEELPTHGGSLRLYVRAAGAELQHQSSGLTLVRQAEAAAGLQELASYHDFAARPFVTKCALLQFLIGAKRAGRRIAGYGAPAKGNTLLNYCGIGPEFIDFTVDRNPHKQNHLLPGSRIPIREPQAIFEFKPDFVLILPWNLRQEVIGQMNDIRRWGGRFVVAIPQLEIIE
jgi:2-polyprenyl-3-methyl-5-hydroxy-6-metoxy-1,4-benzoquinol methylase